MAVVKINLSCELSEAVKVQFLHGNLFSQDNQANVINVAVFEDGEPVELAGTVTANVIRPDGGTVAVTGGTYSGNVATITMPSAVYAIPGAISVAVKITLDSVVTTIAAFAATVYATSTDTAVDPGTIIPSIQTLIAEIEAAVDSIPADYSSMWATLAPNYSNLTFPVAVGQYCTYNGGFYRCNTAIATQEAWTAAHWTATNIGADLAETRLDVANFEDDVSELKSTIGTVPTGKTVEGQIEELQTGKADIIVVTDSTPAAIMSFSDGADGQPMAVKIGIEPVQAGSGDPSPSNVRPISGWTGAKVTRTGKNLFNKNGTNFVKGYPDSEKFNTNNNQGTYYFKCVRGKTYTVSKIATSATGRMGMACCHSIPPTNGMPVSQSISKSNFNVGERASLTITADDDYLLVWAYRKNNDEDSMNTLQFEGGSVATAYEAYAGTEYPVTWQTEAGTVYGGTLTVNKDGSVELTADVGIANASDLTWTYDSTNQYFYAAKSDAKRVTTNTVPEKLISNIYVAESLDNIASSDYVIGLGAGTNCLYIKDSRYTTNEQVQESGAVIVYPLASTFTVTLSASQVKSLLGLNNVWADTGNINSVEYSADTKMYIDGKIADAIANILNA